ncbi:FG-GAP repeat domain-containing protein [Streptoverticillium reticulum]|uniref:FG-GAP repeat domain-containing protein n=1 Tax=Streptoverticillium reticulum TaxID=1433415 RepID=UPI0039BFCC68
MAQLSGRKRGRALSRLATAAIAAALVGATAGTAVATPAPPVPAPLKAAPAVPRDAVHPTAAAPFFPLFATKASGEVYTYEPNLQGGFGDREIVKDSDSRDATASVQVDLNQHGLMDGLYLRATDGSLVFTSVPENENEEPKTGRIGGGWNIYDRILSPGDLTGSGHADLIARDKSGVLWLYQTRQDGTLGDRVRIGRGWDIYTDIVGRGDLNGDGKTDLVAKDRNGVLWFYKGTGNINDPFESRVRVGGGWNTYDMLLSTGDMNADGRSDMLARDHDGVLWLYKGNGNQSDPFENRVRIGGGWGQYNSLF